MNPSFEKGIVFCIFRSRTPLSNISVISRTQSTCKEVELYKAAAIKQHENDNIPAMGLYARIMNRKPLKIFWALAYLFVSEKRSIATEHIVLG